MTALIDLTGQRFDRLVVVGRADNSPSGRAQWECACDCGATTIARSDHLIEGRVKSCGCKRADYARTILGKNNQTHGDSKSPTYTSWKSMKERCLNPNVPNYPRYGGRGVTIHQPWVDSYETFLADVGERPGYDYSIDRIDNTGDYVPGNVRWATRSEQQRNKGGWS